jgi:hypothetical protein
MSAVAIPVCTILAIFGDRATEAIHRYETRAHNYIIHHRPHWRWRHRTASPPPQVGPSP